MSTGTMHLDVTRHYVRLGDRQVHYRQAGSGPVLILLHASPASSVVFLQDHMPVFAREFTCVAPDTPGNGLSTGLPGDPHVEDYSRALAEFLDAIDVQQCMLYGRHTGASIAVEFARLYPERARFVYCDGYPVFPAEKVQAYLTDYLVEFQPDWTGSHLLWLWSRYREQFLFWPWHASDLEHRADADLPDLDFLQRGVLELLMAGNAYVKPYRAAFRHQALETARAVQTPVCYAARRGDSLLRVLDELPPLPEAAFIQEVARDTGEAVATEMTTLLRFKPPENDPAPAAPAPAAGEIGKRFVAVAGGELALREAGAVGSKPPLVMLPHGPGSGAYLEALMRRLAADRRVIAIDLPGHGESEVDCDHGIDTYARLIHGAIRSLGADEFDVYGHQAGAAVAVEMALIEPPVRRLVLDAPVLPDASQREVLARAYQVDFAPEDHGTHLVRLWHHLRDQQLFRPWNQRDRAAARRVQLELDPEQLHRQVLALVGQLPNYAAGWAACFDYNLADRLADVESPTLTLALENDLFADGVAALIRVKAAATSAGVVADNDAKAEAMNAFLG